MDWDTDYKNLSELPEDVEDAVDAITWDNDNSSIFGSYAYRVHTSAGDIDVQEVILGKKSEKDLIKRTLHILKETIKEITSIKGFYFDEIKTGIDYSLFIELGDDYPPSVKKMYKKIKNNQNYKNYTDKEKKEIKKIVKDGNTQELRNYMYRLSFLRFDIKAVKKGYVLQRDGVKRTLRSAVSDGTMLKITAWCPVNGVYTEFTNFYFLVLKDKKKFKYLNFNEKNYVWELIRSMSLFQDKFNYYKMLKRIWGLALYLGNDKLKNLLSKIFRGNIGMLGKMKTDATTLIDMLERIENPPISTIRKQIDQWKTTINNVFVPEELSFIISDKKLYKLINEIIDNDYDKKKWITNLNKIKKMLENYTNYMSFVFHNEHFNHTKIIENFFNKIIKSIEKDEFVPEILPFILEVVDKY